VSSGGLMPMGTGVVKYDREQLIGLLQRDALRRGTFKLAGGRTSHYYVDGRKVTLSAHGAAQVGAGVIEQLKSRPEISAVGGLTMGADPIVGATLAIAEQAGLGHLRGFLVRKETKTHGTGNLIEGPLEPGSTVAILDDVATTGGSSLQAAQAVEAIGCKVAVVIVVLDRLEGAAAAFATRGLPFHPLLTIRDLGVEPLPMDA
jgi:orotate phosphoribosyltransferase